jgi:hypothetical protein
MKRLRILNSALSRIGSRERIVTSSLSRRIDILSYSRKILGSFFGWLADRIMEVEVAWEEKDPWTRTELSEPFNFSISGSIPISLRKIFEPIEIRLNKDGSVIGKFGGSEKNIGTINKDSLGEEEKRIFNHSESIFTIRFYPEGAWSRDAREGGVSTSEGAVGYSAFVRYNDKNGFIRGQIPELYSKLLQYIVHESTHVQQRILAEELDYIDPVFLSKREIGGESRNIVELIHKNRVSGRNAEEEDVEYDEEEVEFDIPVARPAETLDGLMEEKIKKAFDLIDRRIKPDICPELNRKEKENASKIIMEGGTYGELDLVLSENAQLCLDIKDKVNSDRAIGGALSHLTTNKKKMTKWFKYLSKPIEIEAFMRGWRAEMSVHGKRSGGRSFASYFGDIIKRYASSGNLTSEEVSDLWSRYKEVYKSLNYPEKYLGTDEEAISI